MRYIAKRKLRNLMIIFLGAGAFGIAAGLLNSHTLITMMGVSQLGLGGFFGWLFLTQEKPPKDSRRRRYK